MTADEFCCGMNHDINAVFDRPDENWGKCVVHDEYDAVPVCYLGNAVKIGDIGIGISERFGVDYLRVGPDGRFKRLQIVDIQNGVGDALSCQRVCDEVEGTAIEIVGCDDVVSVLEHVLESVSDCSCS